MNRHFHGLAEFAEFLEKQVAVAEGAVGVAARIGADVLHEKAHNVFGDATKLAELAPSTQAERTSLGYTPNDPLLRTGEKLRDNVEKAHDHHTSAIGSSDPVQAYHEFGYVNARTGTSVPPRPAFKIALEESEPAVLELQKGIIAATLGLGPLMKSVADVKKLL